MNAASMPYDLVRMLPERQKFALASACPLPSLARASSVVRNTSSWSRSVSDRGIMFPISRPAPRLDREEPERAVRRPFFEVVTRDLSRK
jgi:hypothetical protein